MVIMGEIVLVVIGILIALAINNANQKRLIEKNENNVLMFCVTSYATEEVHFQPLMQDLDKILKLLDSTKYYIPKNS